MEILNLHRDRLGPYIRAQIANLLPLGGEDAELALIDKHLPEALGRIEHCIAHVKMWKTGYFDVLHSSQYCIFLYYLSNTIWRREQARGVCTKLFLLNKALNAIDAFYEVELPEVFFIGHSVGIVLAKATYGNFLVLYQNSTVGKNHGQAPEIGAGVILYPNTGVIGACRLADGSIISQGTSVINQETRAHCIAYPGQGGKLIFKAPKHNILADFFSGLPAKLQTIGLKA